MIKYFLTRSVLGLSWASGICWYAGRTEGIYPQCQSLSGMLVCTPVDCNEPWTLFTKEQRRKGPHGRGSAREAAQPAQQKRGYYHYDPPRENSIIIHTCINYIIIYMSCAPRTALYQCGKDVLESGGSLTFDLLKVNANCTALSEGLSNYL